MNLESIFYKVINDQKKSLSLLPIKIGLKTLSGVYYLFIQIRFLLYRLKIFKEKRLDADVISVGNITLGGTGKTSLVLKLANLFKKEGKKIAILSRGYKGNLKGKMALVSDGEQIFLKPNQCGDEAFLLAKNLPAGIPVIIGKDRYFSGRYALDKFKVDTLILDDGFQHLKLFRNLDIVLINSSNPFGNNHLFPRGILREPIKNLRRGDVLILTKFDKETKEDPFQNIVKAWGKDQLICKSIHKPVSFIDLRNKTKHGLALIKDKEVRAFSSLGDPLTFEKMLNKLGAKKVVSWRFPDHYSYKQKDIEKIITNFKETKGEVVITTEKDALKLEEMWPKEDIKLYYLKIILELISGQDEFIKILNNERK
ncbi:tetraacyldisaccharide 4'-kinase [bacterium]|nr:tetraacyldisaccharide 4'-kinase [bacterium]